MSTEKIFTNTDSYEVMVGDMVGDMLQGVSAGNSAEQIVYDVQFDEQLKNRLESLKGLDVPSLFEEDRKELIKHRVESIAVSIGQLVTARVSAGSLGPSSYSHGSHRLDTASSGEISHLSPNQWIEDEWAPDYADRFAEAVILGIKRGDFKEI